MMAKTRKTREERIQEILAGAQKSFLEKGYPLTTMEDIIAHTELSKGGVYHYYADKKQILIDMMRQGNIFYMQYNKHMLQIEPKNTDEENIALVTEAILDKFIYQTDEKRIYTMFLCEMLYDQEIWEVFLTLERQFFEWLTSRVEVDLDICIDELKFISRMMNGMMMAQNTSREPKVLETNRQQLRTIFEPLVRKIVMKPSNVNIVKEEI